MTIEFNIISIRAKLNPCFQNNCYILFCDTHVLSTNAR